jgi:hypothetical protein
MARPFAILPVSAQRAEPHEKQDRAYDTAQNEYLHVSSDMPSLPAPGSLETVRCRQSGCINAASQPLVAGFRASQPKRLRDRVRRGINALAKYCRVTVGRDAIYYV